MRTKFMIFLLVLTLISGVHIAQDEDKNPPLTNDSSRYDALATLGNAGIGAELFETFQEDAGFACSTCHLTDSEATLIGPGLVNISIRAETRVAGQSAAHYIFDSIVNPDNHIVEGFSGNLMPENWAQIYSVRDISHIMAYLFTLTDVETTGGEVETVAMTGTLPESSDPTIGEMLFNTFQADAGFACSTCHLVDTENALIGPGLLNIATRATTRITDQDAINYLFTSITEPDVYVVDGFSEDLMPENWAEIYTETEIYHIIAYLLTLEDTE